MREWNFRSGDPLSLFLAADARFGAPDYADDQVWELVLEGGDPPAMAVETMLGLRAIRLRIFPAFVLAGNPISNPSAFAVRPAVRRFAPNYLQVVCRPAAGVEAECEYWVPQSHALAGRITLRATGGEPLSGECWICAALRPAAEGEPFAVESIGPYGGVYLRGRAGNISPVLAMGGVASASRGAVPCLKAAFALRPGEPARIRWAYCGLPSAPAGLALARSLVAREWEADLARVELENAALPEIETGNPDWDSVLAFSQVCAVQSVIGATRHLPSASPVIGRNPERGYSLRGDGSDYPSGWSGASLWDLLMVLPVWGQARSGMAKDLLRNFLAAAGDGLPDARPGAGGQRAHLLAPPLLAQLAWRALSGREDSVFLAELWPLVDRALAAWFSPENDRDQDGIPEWPRVDSLGVETPPIWDRDAPGGGGIPPQEIEAPSLAALLAGECHAAARMAEAAGLDDDARKWLRRAALVKQGLERMEYDSGYRYLDRDTHASPAGKILWEGAPGGGIKSLACPEQARLLLRIAGGSATRPVFRFLLTGRDGIDRPCTEELPSGDFQWLRGSGSCVTRRVWKRIDSLDLEGALEGWTLRIEVPDFRREDISTLLPLWSRVPSPGRAEKKFQRLADPAQFGGRGGLRFLAAGDPAAAEGSRADGWMLWNMLMGEAALRYGKDALALEWIGKMFAAAAEMLRTERAFRSSYWPDRPGGCGPRNSLHGIFPVGLFFAGLGVFPADGNRVWIGGRSIFPQMVTVRHKGLTIRRQADWAEVEFTSGGRRRVDGPERRLISPVMEEILP